MTIRSITVSDADKLEQALAACIASGGSVKAHAKTHGVPVASLRRRWEAHRGNRPPVKEDHPAGLATRGPSRARTPAHARETTVEVECVDGFDPLAASVVQRLEHQFARAYRLVEELTGEGNRALARQWEITAADLGQQLDEARKTEAADKAAREAAAVRDPVELARLALEQIEHLAVLAPVEARQVWRALGVALGEIDAKN